MALAVLVGLCGCHDFADFSEERPTPLPNTDSQVEHWHQTCAGELVDPDGNRLGLPLLTVAGNPVQPGSDLALPATATAVAVQLVNIAGVDGGALVLQHIRIVSNSDAKGKPWLTCMSESPGGCLSPFSQLSAVLDPWCINHLAHQANFTLELDPAASLPRKAEIEFDFDGCGPHYAAMRVTLR